MKFYYMSDLHQDINGDYIQTIQIPEDSKESILLLAGDLHSKGRCTSVADYFADFYKYVVYVYGNHSFYNIAIHETHKFYSNKPNVIHLENNKVVLDGVSIAGCALWHPLNPLDEIWWKYYMNDSRYIRGLNWTRLKWQDIDSLHQQSISFITNTNADILLTHHSLTEQSISDEYKGKLTNKFYATNRDDLLANFKFYVHGHMHHSTNYKLNGCQVLTNPLGYNTTLVDGTILLENRQFNPLKYFEV